VGSSQPPRRRASLPPLPAIPRGSLVFVEGRAPVATHSKEWTVGQAVDVTLIMNDAGRDQRVEDEKWTTQMTKRKS